jgi:outer membrane protein assembly factor BamB
VDPATGKAHWQDGAGGGVYWGSVVLGAGRLYATNQKGRTVVFKPNPEKFEMLASNDLNETCNATPALSDGDLFIRTHAALYRVSE